MSLFELFFDEAMFELIVREKNVYAKSKNVTFNKTTVSEMKCFIGILLVSGYYKVPSYRIMWEETEKVHNYMVANAMRKTRFVDLMRYVHFVTVESGATIRDPDRCSNVRPILDAFKDRCQKYALLTITM